MTLLGTGVLAIWNGIADGRDEAFLEWHVKEHIPERVGVPGFLRGRRYKAIEGDPPYFNFYEVSSPEVLRSPAYLARLNDPTPWTREVVATFTDTARTICRIACSAGTGIGAFATTLGFDAHDDGCADGMCALVRSLAEERAVVGAHLLVSAHGSAVETSESRLRGRADRLWAAVLIVEAADPEALNALDGTALADDTLARAGFAKPAARGRYQLEFCLSAMDREAGAEWGGNLGPSPR
ncbi:MAG: DUF4286 family protein [Alphaproteobacteria bacterium]